jgi:LPXTG-motif cell wall-anchored protein
MSSVILRLGGVLGLIVGAAVMTASFGGASSVSAGGQSCGDAPTATPELSVLQELPTCSPTPTVRIKTHTPTTTPTEVATDTPEPATNTPVPPTKTPQGANEGASVRPPNTGTGGGTGSHVNIWLVAAGAVVAAAGGGALVAGARKRS